MSHFLSNFLAFLTIYELICLKWGGVIFPSSISFSEQSPVQWFLALDLESDSSSQLESLSAIISRGDLGIYPFLQDSNYMKVIMTTSTEAASSKGRQKKMCFFSHADSTIKHPGMPSTLNGFSACFQSIDYGKMLILFLKVIIGCQKSYYDLIIYRKWIIII
jgi:hypothetical protein